MDQLLFAKATRTKEFQLTAKNATAIFVLTAKWIILIMQKEILKMLPKKYYSKKSKKKEMISKQVLMNLITSILNLKIFSTSK